MQFVQLLLFSLLCTVIIYGASCLKTQGLRKVDPLRAGLYVATFALVGVFAEVFFDSIYTLLFGHPLWEYHVWPVHRAYTSYYSLAIWGMYGFFIYLFHDVLKSGRIVRLSKRLTFTLAAEAVMLEAAVNILFLAIFGQYIFYYLPNDIWHLTSIQAVPIYCLAGFILRTSIKHTKQDPVFFIVVDFMLAGILVFLS